MQTFRSDHGHIGCRVPDQTPTRAIAHRLGTLYVGKSDAYVRDMIRDAITKQILAGNGDAWTPELCRAAERYAVWQHRENRALYDVAMGASL